MDHPPGGWTIWKYGGAATLLVLFCLGLLNLTTALAVLVLTWTCGFIFYILGTLWQFALIAERDRDWLPIFVVLTALLWTNSFVPQLVLGRQQLATYASLIYGYFPTGVFIMKLLFWKGRWDRMGRAVCLGYFGFFIAFVGALPALFLYVKPAFSH